MDVDLSEFVMEQPLKQLLTKWGVPGKVLKQFEANEITSLRHLAALTLEDIATFMTPGQKILLRAPLAAWQAEWKDKIEREEEVSNTVETVLVDVHNPSAVLMETSQETPPRESESMDVDTSAMDKVAQTLVFDIPETSSSESSSDMPSNVGVTNNSGANPAMVLKTHITTADTLMIVLQNCNAGTLILGEFKSTGALSERSRDRLTHVLVNHELHLSPIKRITSDQFQKLRDLIVTTFPGEKGSKYFSPAVSKSKKTSRATGKLVNYYHNFRRQLRSVKVLPSARSSNHSKVLAEDVQNALKCLEQSAEHYDVVLKHWIKSHTARLEKLEENSDRQVHSYLAKYPCLRKQFGVTLLLEDFKILYPDKELTLFDQWPLFRLKFLAYIRDTVSKDEQFSALLKELDIDLEACSIEDENQLNLQTLQCLLLCLPQKATRGSKKVWKPKSKVELLHFFIPQVNSVSDLRNTIQTKKVDYAKFEIPIQPFPAVVKDKAQNIVQYYVCIDSNLYTQTSLLEAIDSVFKACNVLFASYPFEAKYLYAFLQSYIYEISTKYDTKYNIVEKFVEKFDKFVFE